MYEGVNEDLTKGSENKNDWRKEQSTFNMGD